MARERRSLQDLIRSRQQSGFVERQRQVVQYQENLGFPVDDERPRFLFSIHGDAGVGKTYLTKHKVSKQGGNRVSTNAGQPSSKASPAKTSPGPSATATRRRRSSHQTDPS